tara:strand:+ start:1319 stop:1642 length:324 start_codon:yes stop_codon:yes gene_type:complete
MSLFKDIRFENMSLKYIDFIRSHNQCCVCLQFTEIEPHHLNSIGMGRNRKNDMIEHFSAIPVCRTCHMDYHQIGLKEFEKKHHQNMFQTNHKYLSKFIYEISINQNH